MPTRGRRQLLARYAAPAAFLLAVTILVLLVRSGLGGGGSAPGTTATRTQTTRTQTTRQATTAKTVATTPAAPTGTAPVTTIIAGATYYTVQKGDTFSIIATKEGTTVAQIEQLNPGVSSNALQVGQRIRVK
jgi:LysM repeat protein